MSRDQLDIQLLKQAFIFENLERRELGARLVITNEESSIRTNEVISSFIQGLLKLSSSSSASHKTTSSSSRSLAMVPSPPSSNGNPSSARQCAKIVGSQLIICSSPQESNIRPPSASPRRHNKHNNSGHHRTTSPSSRGLSLSQENPDNNNNGEGNDHSRLVPPEDEEIFRGEAVTEEGLRLQFSILDQNKSGFLEKEEFRFFFCEELESFGLKPSQSEFEYQWKKICGADQNRLDFSKFAVFMLKRVKM